MQPEVEDSKAYTLNNVNVSKANKKFKDLVEITCNDGEMFPVRKKILTPCIKLTSVVADGLGKYRKQTDLDGREGSEEIVQNSADENKAVQTTVDIDCLTFDRCLLYLESECRGTGELMILKHSIMRICWMQQKN